MSTVRPVNRMWVPRDSLTSCMRCVMGRDTRGVALTDAQRFNHFPATPLCTVSWWFSGTGELLQPGAPATLDVPREPPAARVLFSGPQSRPLVSWNPGPVHGFMLLLAPDALHLMTGLDVAAWVDRWSPVSDALPPAWDVMGQAVLHAPDDDDDARVHIIESFLEPLWLSHRPGSALGLDRVQDWAQGLAMRAATSAPGRSLRQVERRIKQWAGQPLRELRGLGRAEQAFFSAVLMQGEEKVPWADIAAEVGYADQSHLCRDTRRVTGFTPEALKRHLEGDDEPFWAYRLWM